ncbi:transmembrane sensor [Pedobacter africanus]|uniref:Ferric-dicitrate binding protein FerR (Iron transport regulator) n=1 Tax=Pedobacter africanus TaxID=151894 RepID=A0ACC6L576_9SPHI|nr:FecR domain-containing protein [Pedobacter africanus]MDR6786453.1 ferric-dicitrate binding protein FerR (iron transport regulator) [Pedobacter africanus]
MMEDKELKRLLAKYKEGTCSAEEKALLENWVASAVYPEYQISEKDLAHDLSEISKTLPLVHQKRSLWPRYAGIAAAVAAITFGIWFYTSRNTNTLPHPELVAGSQDIAPGKNTATLSLAGGKAITLSDAHTGVIIDASQIKYNDGSDVGALAPLGRDGEAREGSTLTLTTPRGGTYQITLPDGTKVWLNAASSLTYHMPLKERGGVRKVELSGEAYFEVFRNKLQPFVVNSKKMELTVLGTHFNVNAYNDETNIKATLLEGSVRVRSTASPPVTLKPNQQAVVKENDIDCILVDPEQSVAWKNNKFMFDDQSITYVMRMIARWYDVEVIYTGAVPTNKFWGAVSKYENVSEVLKSLESTGKVHFKIEDRKIYVSK